MQARRRARNNALPYGTNMPKLPLEVIQKIFTVSLPPGPNYRPRFPILLPLCLVHRSLTRSVQRILFANVSPSGMKPIRRFLESLELVPESRRWVKSLELALYGGGGRNVAEVNKALSSITEHCIELEGIQIFFGERLNLALLAQLKHLRSLEFYGLNLAYFKPIVGKSGTFESLVFLSFDAGGPIKSSDPSFFSPEVLPSLRRLSIDPGSGKGPINSITDLYAIASQLRHLSWERSNLDPLLVKCTNLLSLTAAISDIVSSTRRLSKPLVGLQLWSKVEDEELDKVMELLENALSNGLISRSADSGTVIFLCRNEKDDPKASRFKRWTESVGSAIEYQDGALQREWSGDGRVYSKFEKWVDKKAARRESGAGGEEDQAIV